jgi:putative salt-induced outer membrane protein YdiY
VVAAALVALGAGRAVAQQTLTLDSGDRLSGRLRSIRNGTWVFQFRGTDLRIPVDSVRGLRSPAPIGVRLRDGTVVTATIEPADPGRVLTLPESSQRPVQVGALVAIGSADNLAALRRRGLLGGVLDRWTLTGSLGFSDKRGNSRARGIVAGFQVTRRGDHLRVDVGASGAREESAPSDTVELQTTVAKAQEHVQLDWYVQPRLFLTVGIRQEQDRFQDLDLRSTYSAGLGYQAVAAKRTELRLTLNGGWRREAFVSGGEASTAVVGVAAAFRQSVGPVALEWRVTFDPRATDIEDFRLVSRTTITTRLYGGLGLRFEILDEYNSRPRDGVRPNDLLTTTTITYSLGR